MSPARLPSSPRLPLSRGVSITLQPGQARTLHLPAAGTLSVAQGALWVTRRGRHVDHPAQDLYVSAGLALALDAGDSVVIEPMHLADTPAAQVPPASFSWQADEGHCAGLLRWLRQHLQAAWRPAPARAPCA